ncbi:N-acetyl-gamma-glutamyl-phosphate reductase [Candidatus Omnitrophota bacterium]
MINAGIIGATGYTGEELIELLLRHPEVRITYLAAKIDEPAPIAEIFPKFRNRTGLVCGLLDLDSAISSCELLFLALPHTVSMGIAPRLLDAGKRVIDLSADYRLEDSKIYEQFYKTRQTDSKNLKKAVYGLPEIYRAKIKQASLVANPGCFPTAAILGLAPLVSCKSSRIAQPIIIDAITGVTGAGRRAALAYSFCEIEQDAYAYKINAHQHTPEISQELSRLASGRLEITFVPHLVSIDRGILETIYVRYDEKMKVEDKKLADLYNKFYKKEPFVRIKQEGEGVHLKDVARTNLCDIAIKAFPQENLIIITAAIDNLGKGAAGQAVQNMNIMYGFPEQTALF